MAACEYIPILQGISAFTFLKKACKWVSQSGKLLCWKSFNIICVAIVSFMLFWIHLKTCKNVVKFCIFLVPPVTFVPFLSSAQAIITGHHPLCNI